MTDKVKLYVVRNDDGEYLMDPAFAAWFPDWTDDIITADLYEHKEAAEETANECDGHVVELVEKPAKVVVSEEEAEMLEQAKCDDDPAELIVGFVNSHDNYDDDCKAEDRLMRAYVNGYTVAK
ncbi:hypothetical protein [Lacticaseibacillus suibinensis]|uniref:hypothetical protein n=1 Tax=Lacticaseibacillus suibinensis TaxID=2486011 RepID=UPI002989C857|nr:hypothetical protein [Lacticaseibacillus suibinensis]